MAEDETLLNWQPCDLPGERSLIGAFCIFEPYSEADHLEGLFQAVAGPGNEGIWQFMPLGPFDNSDAFAQALTYTQIQIGWKTMVIRCATSKAIMGMASYMRIRPEHGSVEVGCIAFSHQLKRTRIATEAIYLMMRHVFDGIGYRRFEWKCDNSNAASKSAAARFGFTFEGVFRNDMIVKGRNRDTAWYSITSDEWPTLNSMYQAWLASDNFDEDGQQRRKLSVFMS